VQAQRWQKEIRLLPHDQVEQALLYQDICGLEAHGHSRRERLKLARIYPSRRQESLRDSMGVSSAEKGQGMKPSTKKFVIIAAVILIAVAMINLIK